MVEVVAHKNLRMRGQAFVVFGAAGAAAAAIKGLHRRAVFGKPMLLGAASRRSYAAVECELVGEDGEGREQFEEYKKSARAEAEKRWAEKAASTKRAAGPQDAQTGGPATKRRRFDQAAPAGTTAATANTAPVSSKKARNAENQLPPNKILFLQELPPGVQAGPVEAVFDKFAGFREVRLMAVRRLGFVEFETEQAAIAAREGTRNLVLEGYPVKVTYAKK